MKKRIALISPNAWDQEEIDLRQDQYEFIPYGPDFQKSNPKLLDVVSFLISFDIEKFVDQAVHDLKEMGVDAVLGTDEYLACSVAAIIAERLGLPGPSPGAILIAQSKYHSRLLQKELFSSITPATHAMGFDGKTNGIAENDFPLFVKPVRGASSLLAKEIVSQSDLKSHVALPFIQRFLLGRMLKPYKQLLKKYASIDLGAIRFVAETPMRGVQVTLEGFAYDGEVHFFGIVDSVMYSGSKIAFERFEYPSRLPESVQHRMKMKAIKLVQHFELRHGMFNIEFFYDELRDLVQVIEINPRLSFQFTDLFQRVDGTNTYGAQIELSLGNLPLVRNREGKDKVAASFVFRSFQDGYVIKTPSTEKIKQLELKYDARIRNLVTAGKKLSSDFLQDTESYRYAVVNLGASSFEELYSKFSDLKLEFEYQFEKSVRTKKHAFFGHIFGRPERENASV